MEQQPPPPTPKRCPRCNSLDTNFRYYNNNDREQPRHYCRTCKRHWTVGGTLRNIPIGGRPRNNRRTRASSSRNANPHPHRHPHPQYLQSLTPLTTMVPQNLYTTMNQPIRHVPTIAPQLSSYYYNDEISCWDAIQSLIQSDGINYNLNAGYQFGSGGNANAAIPNDWNIQSMTSQYALPQQQIPQFVESYQTNNRVNNAAPSLYDNSLVQPTWPTNSLSQDVMTNFGSSTSNSCPGNNIIGTTTDTNTEMDASFVDVDQWLNIPDYGSS
ncbi:hypothetical protein ABFX02_08G031800 [Erythranthe guttata]